MSNAETEVLKTRLHLFCHVNAFDLVGLKENLAEPRSAPFRAQFSAALDAALAGNGLTRAEYEAETGEEFEDDAAYLRWLAGVKSFLFGDGKHP